MYLPNIIETPDFQALLNDSLDRFSAAAAKAIPGFTRPTPADPSYHILVELTLLRVIITEKVNAAAYAQLIKLTNDLEFIFNGKLRPGESYDAYRERMRGTRDQASPAGTAAMYKALTFLYGEFTDSSGQPTRSASVMDAYVQAVNGDILIHVLMNTDAADLKAGILATLTEAFKKESIKPALDAVSFIEARAVPFTISAGITLLPGYGLDFRDTIEKTFRASFEAQKRLGWAPAVSWITKELHQTGVKSVILKSPVTNIPVQVERYAAISKLDLTVETSA